MAIAGKIGAVYAVEADGASTAFTDEPTTANGDYTRYTITDAAKRYWNRDITVTVKVNNVVQTGGFSIEYVGGVVVFDSALSGTDVVTVSGEYYTVSQFAGLKNWNIDPNANLEDSTTFESNGWKEYATTIGEASGSCEGFWLTGDGDLSGKLYIFVLYIDETNKYRLEGYGRFSTHSVDVPVDSLVSKSLDFNIDGTLYYREGA